LEKKKLYTAGPKARNRNEERISDRPSKGLGRKTCLTGVSRCILKREKVSSAGRNSSGVAKTVVKPEE